MSVLNLFVDWNFVSFIVFVSMFFLLITNDAAFFDSQLSLPLNYLPVYTFSFQIGFMLFVIDLYRLIDG